MRQRQPDEDQRAAQRRHVQFNNRAQEAEFDPDNAISPPTLRSKTRSSGVPVPNIPFPSAPLERSHRERNIANQILNQYRQQQEAQRNQPPQQEPREN